MGWGGKITYGAQVAPMPAVVWFSHELQSRTQNHAAEFGL